MGRKFAPAYANIFLSEWESNLFNSYSFKPSRWYRYIDDIFGIWPHGFMQFCLFINFINNFDSDIQVSPFISYDNVNFLDVNVFKHKNLLLYRSYIKETSSLKTLPYSSFHPNHVAKGVICSNITRISKRNYFKEDFDKTVSLYFKAWRSQGFNYRFLRNCKYECMQKLDILKVFSFGFFKCNRDSCSYCEYATFNNFYDCNNTRFRIVKRITCNTLGCIYLLFCKICGFIYVGETGETLRLRISNHLSKIRTKSDTPVSNHFNSLNHSISDFNFIGIDFCTDVIKRRNLEYKYIRKLNPPLNNLSCNIPKCVYATFPYSHKSVDLIRCTRQILKDKVNIKFSHSNYLPNLNRTFQRKF